MGKKSALFLLVFLPLVSLIGLASAEIFSSCGTISSSGYYELNQSISTTDTCVTITTSNVELDCKGYTMNYSSTGTATRFGVDAVLGVTPLSNITIKNCNIYRPTNSSTAGYGIRMQRTSDSYIFNNTITTNGTTNNYGIYLLTSNNRNRIVNNTIIATGMSTGNIGIYAVSDSNDNNITGNTVRTLGTTTGYAIFLSTDSNDNIIENNNLSAVSFTTTASNGHTINIFSSKRNDILNNVVSTRGIGTNYAIYMNINANNNTIANNIVSSSGTATTNYGIYALNSRLNTIQNNTVITSGTTTNHGIVFSGSYDSLASNNIVNATGSSTGNFGIYSIDSLLIDIENNTISTLGTTTGYGVSIMTSSYVNVKNNNISTNGTGATNTGILVTTSFFNEIDRNNIATWGTSANAGIFLTTTSNENKIRNNTILSRGTTTTNYGIYATQSQFNEISGNDISTNGGTTTNYGIHFITQANRNVIRDNAIRTYGTTTNYGIFLSTSSYNDFIGNNISTNGSTRSGNTNNWGYHLTTTSNENKFYNGSITTDGGASNYGVYLLTDSDRNIVQGNTINSGGDAATNIGALLTASSKNTIKDNIISTRGTATNYGIELFSSSAYNLIENNTLSTSGSTNSYGLYLLFSTPNYPTNNNFSRNNLISIAGNDLQVGTASINGTWLIDQSIGNYTFTGTSGTLNLKNSSSGEIKFNPVLSGTNTTFSNRVYIRDNFAFIDEYTTLLNRSAEITLYNRPTTSIELQILRNGVVCPSAICTNLTSMQAGNVTFNVTSGGNYSINSSTVSPVVTLNDPVNSFNASTETLSFNFTVSDDVSTSLNCSIYLNSILNQTNSTTLNGTLTNFEIQSLEEGDSSWYVSCLDEGGNLGESETRTFNVNYTIPTVILNSPINNSYINGVNSALLSYTIYDTGLNNNTVWLYGNNTLLNTSYNISNGTTLTYLWTGRNLGAHNWSVISNNGLKNSSSSTMFFNLINLTINCEAGGPYQEGGLVLIQGNVSDGISGLSSQTLNISLYKDGVINSSNNLISLSGGAFQTTFSNLANANYTLNTSVVYQGINGSCFDSFNLSSSTVASSPTAANLILDKIVSLHNISNNTINYNVTLRLTNTGGINSTNTNITDLDSINSPYILNNITPGQSILRSYILNYSRNSSGYSVNLSKALSYGVDNYYGLSLNSNSSVISVSVPSTTTGSQLTLVKNAYFNSENSTVVNYTIGVEVVNSGGEDLTAITFIDSDLDLNTLINLNRTQSYNHSSSIIIQKEATNSERLLVKSTSTVNTITYESNQINLQIAGYGGPADTIVYAQASVNTSTSFDSIIEITNQNIDIGQNFLADYWITNDAETINYSSGQQTIYVSALGSTNLTATLTSPSVEGTYRLRALVSYVGGPDFAFDSFEVTASSLGTTSGSSTGGGSSESSSGSSRRTSTQSNGSITGSAVEEIICNYPYIRYGKDCCLDNNGDSICDEDEIIESKSESKPFISRIINWLNLKLLKLELTGLAYFESTNIKKVLSLIATGLLVITSLSILIFLKFIKDRTPKDTKRLNHIKGTKVYFENGDFAGKIIDVYLEYQATRIYGWVIKLDKKLSKKTGLKNIMVRQNLVKSIKQIMIIEERVVSHLENYKEED